MTEENFLRNAFNLAKKDFVIELRRAHEFLSIIAFSLSSILVSSFAWRGGLNLESETVSAILWIIIYFSTVLALTTSFSREVDRGTIDGLRSLPCSALTILLGKIIYTTLLLSVVIIITFLASVFFLNLSLNSVPSLAFVLLMGAINLSLVGSVISAVVMYSEGKNLLLSFLFFPVSVPVLLPSTQATEKLVSGMTFIDIIPDLKLLIAFTLAVSAISILLFQKIFQE